MRFPFHECHKLLVWVFPKHRSIEWKVGTNFPDLLNYRSKPTPIPRSYNDSHSLCLCDKVFKFTLDNFFSQDRIDSNSFFVLEILFETYRGLNTIKFYYDKTTIKDRRGE